MAELKFDLRAYLFIDRLQPQLAQFVAKDNKVYDPAEYDACIMLELAPAMEIHTMIDLALKATKVRLGSVVTERFFGLMQIQHADQGEVLAAGKAVLDATGKTVADRSLVEILTNKVIRHVEQDHAISFTGASRGNMIVAGESLLIMETAPAAYLTLGCNEALKAARVKLNLVRPFGATGRLVLSGPEAEIDAAAAAAVDALEKLNAETRALGGGQKKEDGKYGK
jgi:ethanolamine utilization microcompartment shell protein EutS